MKHRALRLDDDLFLRLVETPRPPIVMNNEIPVKPTQVCIIPETTTLNVLDLWPSMHYAARPIETNVHAPDTLVHAPRDCGEMMRHAGRTLPLKVLGAHPEHVLASPRGMKYPCLAPLISSAYRAYKHSMGRVLLIAGDSPLARLLAGLLEHSVRVYPPPKKQWGHAHGVREEDLKEGKWDTLIIWSLDNESASKAIEQARYKRILVNPLIACHYSLPLKGALGGRLEILWPKALPDTLLAKLEKKILKKTSIIEVRPNYLPLKLDWRKHGIIIVNLA